MIHKLKNLFDDLSKMIFHVSVIISDQIIQSYRFALRDFFPLDHIKIVAVVFFCSNFVRHRFKYANHLHVVLLPKINYEIPTCRLIILRRNPFVLIVTGENQIVLKLSIDKSCSVVHRRINQMPQNFFLRSFVRRRFETACLFGNGTKFLLGFNKKCFRLLYKFFHSGLSTF